MQANPLLSSEGLPQFESIRAEHVAPAVTAVLQDCETLLAELSRQDPQQLTLADLNARIDLIQRKLHRTWSPVNHLLGTMNHPALREAHEAMQAKVVGFGLKFSQNETVYKTLLAIKQKNLAALNETDRRLVELGIRDAELSGIGLSGAKKDRFNEISQELSALATTFSNNVLDATKAFAMDLTVPADVDGLSANAKAQAAQAYALAHPNHSADAERGPWRITLDVPSYLAFMQQAKNRTLRERLYRANISRAAAGDHSNAELLPRILQLRQEKAQLLGFQNYAELSLARKMAGQLSAVHSLSHELLNASKNAAMKEFAELSNFAKAKGQSEALAHWDVAYWGERMREERFQYTDEELKPYFPLPQVLDGMFALVRKIFGIEIVDATASAPRWHKDVLFFKIFDGAAHIASFYLDPYARSENKRGGAWMDDCLGRETINGKLQQPVAYLICNSTPPLGDAPSLMTFNEVTTLFHEFGHGLQHMLTRVETPQLAGINGVEWDAVELPSQFMENWCYHKPTLLGLAKHYQTKQPLPDDLFHKLDAAKHFMAASQMLRQLRFGMTDMALHEHSGPLTTAQIFDIAQNIAAQTSALAPLPDDRMLCSFSHIFAGGYAAGYYSYKWAEVLSADAFAAFEDAGLDNDAAMIAVGQKFRESVLALGGSRHPMDVFKMFRGRAPNTAALLRHSGLVA